MERVSPMINISSNIKKCTNTLKSKISSGMYPPGAGEIRFKHGLDFDVFQPESRHGLSKLKDICAGEFGTTCKGAIPLEDFFGKTNPEKKNELLRKGISTNDTGHAFTFLKSKSDRPLSTSYVCDCSVLYLYNKNADTHMLYHLYSTTNEGDINTIINKLMPEGFTYAGIVPGTKEQIFKHEEYLPKVFSALKEHNKDAKICVYTESSKYPEIVGYKGKMYEIPNKKIKNNIVLNSDFGQASFDICDINFHDVVIGINMCDDIPSLKHLKKILQNENYSEECRHTIEKLIYERARNIRIIEGCRTLTELFEFMKDKTHKFILGDIHIGDRGYFDIISDKKIKLSRANN